MSAPIIRLADTFSPLGIEAEFGRTCPVECEQWGASTVFKLVSDEIVADERCDELLNDYLQRHGWRTDGGDVCPTCAEHRTAPVTVPSVAELRLNYMHNVPTECSWSVDPMSDLGRFPIRWRCDGCGAYRWTYSADTLDAETGAGS